MTSGLRALQLAREGEVPAELRDLDCDGHVSAIEWLRGGIDFRIRPSAQVPGCQELVHAKANEVVILRCSEPPLCRRVRALAPASGRPVPAGAEGR